MFRNGAPRGPSRFLVGFRQDSVKAPSGKKKSSSRSGSGYDYRARRHFGRSTHGGQFFGIHASNNGRVMIFAGGIPLKRGDEVMGAIGVSGGSGQQDHAVAEAGAKAF